MVGSCADRAPHRPISSGPATHQIYVVDRGWHTDIGLPVGELEGRLAALKADFPGATYLVFGFGDRNFLLTRDTGLFDMLHALLPGKAAMLVTGLKTSPGDAFVPRDVVPLGVSATGIRGIEDFIAADFSADSRGGVIRLADGPYPGSLFFASDATYDAFYTCNSWVADALRAAGLPVSDGLVIFAYQVMAEARALTGREVERH